MAAAIHRALRPCPLFKGRTEAQVVDAHPAPRRLRRPALLPVSASTGSRDPLSLSQTQWSTSSTHHALGVSLSSSGSSSNSSGHGVESGYRSDSSTRLSALAMQRTAATCLDQEWLRLGLGGAAAPKSFGLSQQQQESNAIARSEDVDDDDWLARSLSMVGVEHGPSDATEKMSVAKSVDAVWLYLGLSSPSLSPTHTPATFPTSPISVTAATTAAAAPAASEKPAWSLDDVWLNMGMGLTVPGSIPAAVSEAAAAAVPLNLLDDVWLNVGMGLTLPGSPEWNGEEKCGVVAARPVGDAFFVDDLRPIALFDGVCNMCSQWTQFLLDWDPHGNLRFASMQGDAGKQLLKRAGMAEDDTSDIILVAHDKAYVGTEAILEIFSRLAMPFPAIAATGRVTPRALHKAVYKFVSNNRHRFGAAACRLFDPRFADRFLS